MDKGVLLILGILVVIAVLALVGGIGGAFTNYFDVGEGGWAFIVLVLLGILVPLFFILRRRGKS
jgi:hypothetical protein